MITSNKKLIIMKKIFNTPPKGANVPDGDEWDDYAVIADDF